MSGLGHGASPRPCPGAGGCASPRRPAIGNGTGRRGWSPVSWPRCATGARRAPPGCEAALPGHFPPRRPLRRCFFFFFLGGRGCLSCGRRGECLGELRDPQPFPMPGRHPDGGRGVRSGSTPAPAGLTFRLHGSPIFTPRQHPVADLPAGEGWGGSRTPRTHRPGGRVAARLGGTGAAKSAPASAGSLPES